METGQRPMTTRGLRVKMYGSLVASIGTHIVTAIVPIVLAVEACIMIGLQMGPGNLIMKYFYWHLIIMLALPVFGVALFPIAVAVASKGAAMCAIIFYGLSTAWRLWSVIYLTLIMVTCDGDVNCADNLDCLGAMTGVYGGATPRFIGLFAMAWITFAVHIIAFAISFTLYKDIASRREPAFGRHVPGVTDAYPGVTANPAYNVANPLQAQQQYDELAASPAYMPSVRNRNNPPQ